MKAIAERHKVIPAVYVLLRKSEGASEKVLLMRRANTGYRDGDFSLPSGHVGGADEKGGESALTAAVREAKEEIGVDIRPEDLRLVHTLHRYSELPEPHERIDLFFETERWQGNPINAEPSKCSDIRWSKLTELPDNLTPEVHRMFIKLAKGEPYSELDFSFQGKISGS
jgi:8-oxo-dGTP diphosphatase